MTDRRADLLIARLRLLSHGRRFLVTSARECDAVVGVAMGLVRAWRDLEPDVELVDLTTSRATPAASEPLASALAAGDSEAARAALRVMPGAVVLAADALLTRGMPVTLSAIVDGVVLVIHEGRTRRADLEIGARTIREIGGRLLLAAYVR